MITVEATIDIIGSTPYRLATQLADASIIMAPRAFEPKTNECITEWFEGGLGKKLFHVGPQIPVYPPVYQTPTHASHPSHPFAPIFSFLDAQTTPKSVIVISFGSLWYPAEPKWLIETLVTTLMETQTPFLFSRMAFMSSPLDPVLEKAVTERSLGMIVEYIPQRDVLGHPSVGAFLTHGGINSLFESILAGVTNIFWPLLGDQPLHAAYMALKVRSSALLEW